MRYFVTVAERQVEVVIDGDRVVVDGEPVSARLEAIDGTPQVVLHLDGRRYPLAVAGRGDEGWTLVDRGSVHTIEAVDERTRHIRTLAGAGRAGGSGGVVKAPMPGLVVRVLVEVGQAVRAGQGLVVLEAMKMENELKAPADGMVTAVGASQGQAVDKGAVLVELGPMEDG